MFWTLGGKQVGKAALAGWAYLSAASPESIRYWPFHGPLTALLDGDPNTVVVSETYPREFYQHFRSGPGGRGSKTKQEDRLQWISGLFRWADSLGVSWGVDLVGRVEAGFSDDINGEDEFDAVVGLLGMISVVRGAIESGEPTDDPAVTSVEGWILGRHPGGRSVVPADTASSVERPKKGGAKNDSVEAAWQRMGGLSQERQRASIEATLARLISFARSVGYSDDELMALLVLELKMK
jgi:hypothetical protein